MRIKFPKIQGFTLLELLVVITLLAILSSVALMSNDGVRDQAEVDTTKYEMTELRKALLQFKRDTGYFPRHTNYDCVQVAESVRTYETANPGKFWPEYAPSALPTPSTNWVNWCSDTANFWMLFQDPIPDTSNDWNPDTKRGWHGPYINKSGATYLGGTALRGVSDGFANNQLVWRLRPNDAEYLTSGSSYSLFDLEDTTPDDDTDGVPRLVSFGPDGIDGAGGSVNATHSSCTPIANSDDIVLCLLK